MAMFRRLMVVVCISFCTTQIASCSRNSNDSSGANLTGGKQRTATQASANLSAVPQLSPGTIRLIEARQWKDASRAVYREAASIYPRDTDTAINQGLSGFVDDALETANNMRPSVRSWVFFRIARDSKLLSESQRITLLNQAAETVRGKPIDANLAASSFANAATAFSSLNRSQHAASLMSEALAVAKSANGEMQGAAARALVDALDRAPDASIKPLVFIAEEAARISVDPFHKSFSYAGLASIWIRLDNHERARQWWRDGLPIAKQVNSKQRAIAENQFAIVALKLGDRSEAERQVASRNGTFIDFVAKEMINDAAERGSYDLAMRDAENIKDNCTSLSTVRGSALRNLAVLQARKNDIAAARNTLAAMKGCLPTLVGSALLAIGDAEFAAGQRDFAVKDYSEALSYSGVNQGRPLTQREVSLLTEIGQSIARAGQAKEAADLLKIAIAEIGQMGSDNIERRADGIAKAALAIAQHTVNAPSAETAIAAYRMVYLSPNQGMYPEMGRASALAKVGLLLSSLAELSQVK